MPEPYAVALDEARPALLAELDAFHSTATSFDDLALLGASSVHGWSRVDCLVHLRMGLEELLAGIPARAEGAPDVDAASYWSTFEADDDPVPGILMTRRTASAYSRPTRSTEHLRQVTDGLRHIVPTMSEGAVRFQGHTISTGDLLATWAVEVLVHRWDMAAPGEFAADSDAARIGRRTVEALGGVVASGAAGSDGADRSNDDLTVLLRGFGRV